MTIQEIFQKGGPTLWPLFILSILSLTTIVERLWFWFNLLAEEKQIVNRILEAARRDWSIAFEIARQASRQPIGRFLYAPLRLNYPEPEVFRLALESTAEEELAAMRRGDKILEAVITLSPLLGLLGTVLGLINSLGSIRLGDIGTSATAGVTLGISEALISTASGLIVAIFALAFYRIFQALIFNQVKIFRRSGNELELLYRQYWAQLHPENLSPQPSPPNPDQNDYSPEKNLQKSSQKDNMEELSSPEKNWLKSLPEKKGDESSSPEQNGEDSPN